MKFVQFQTSDLIPVWINPAGVHAVYGEAEYNASTHTVTSWRTFIVVANGLTYTVRIPPTEVVEKLERNSK